MRDVLHADDMKTLYLAAANSIDRVNGQVFNVGGGVENSLSLLELFGLLESHINMNLKYDQLPVRESDQRVFISDLSKVQELLKWTPIVSAKEGVSEMLKWTRKYYVQ